MPVLIKRYPNRKMYDTNRKRYISLDEIARLIRQGEEVSILDHDSGEDLTALTLAQVIMDQEKRTSGFLPGSLLAGMVQAGRQPIERMRKILVHPLGVGRLVDEELERRIEVLVTEKALSPVEGKRLLVKLVEAGQDEGELTFAEAAIRSYLDEQEIPTRQDLIKLRLQVEELVEELEKYESA